MGKLFKIFSSRISYLFGIPLAGITALSSRGTWKNISLSSTTEHNYLARLQLDQWNQENTEEKLRENRRRLSEFYRKYGTSNVGVNISKSKDTNGHSDLFIHFRSPSQVSNPNRLWMDNVHLNQLSIDRYGPSYDSSTGAAKDNTSKVHEIVRWRDVSLETVSHESPGPSGGLSFNFINKDISKEEVEILINGEENKFKPSANESNDWFVWMDKDLLALKLNYALQTFVFNRVPHESSISSIIGNESTRSPDQEKKYESLKENFANLTEEEKEFSKNYITSFLDESTSKIDEITNWGNIVNSVVTQSYFISSGDLNKIYNKFSSSGKSTALFRPHLISRITSGKDGNWKNSLSLSAKAPSDKESSSTPKYEARTISKLTQSSTEEEKNKGKIKIFVNSAVNSGLKMGEIYEWITKYSVKHFSPRTKSQSQNMVISSAYSSSGDSKNEAFHVLRMDRKNEFGLSKIHLIPAALGAIFLISVAFFIIKTFRAPGGIFTANIAAGISCVGAVFFGLGSKLSLVGVSALAVGVLYALFLSYYILSLLRRLFAIEFLDKDNTFVVFKRGLIFSTDISFPIFITSSLISFLAPLGLREFGIVLSLCVIFFFPLVTLSSTLMSLGYVNANFLRIGNLYRRAPVNGGIFLDRFCGVFPAKKLLAGGLGFAAICFFSLVLFFTLGFNSFSFLRENHLYLVNQTGQKVDLGSGFKQIGQFGDLVGYLGPLSGTPNNLSDKNYYVQLTDSYSDFFVLRDLMSVFGIILLFVVLYVLVRFGIKNVVIFLLNSSVSLVFLAASALILRISIGSGIFIGLCAWLSFLIMYNILFFCHEKNERMDWFERIGRGIFSDVFMVMRTSICLFLLLGLMSMNEETIVVNLYISMVLLLTHYFTTFVYHILLDGFRRLKGKYIRRSENASEIEELENLDEFDEELILGINCR